MRRLSDGFELDDDRDRLDIAVIHSYLSVEAYWAAGRTRETVEASIAGSARVVGLYRDGRQLGFARVVSEAVDRGPHRKVPCILHTADAHALYERLGFRRVGERLMERP